MLKGKGILVVLAVAATMVVGVSSASAGTTRFTTHIVFLGNDGPSIDDQTLFGDLNTRPRCRGARQVGLFKRTRTGFRLLDVDLSSFNGAWAVRGDLTDSPELAIQVKREKRNHGRVVCKAATLLLTQESPAYPQAG